MTADVLFFRHEGGLPPVASLPDGFDATFWQPSFRAPFPPATRDPRLIAYTGMACIGALDRRNYAALVFRDDQGQVAHRSFIMPRFSRFPFMGERDVQIGAVETWPAFRGRGLAPLAISMIVQRYAQPGRAIWYLTEADNLASVAAIRKAGFALAGRGGKRARMGLKFLGFYDMAPAGSNGSPQPAISSTPPSQG